MRAESLWRAAGKQMDPNLDSHPIFSGAQGPLINRKPPRLAEALPWSFSFSNVAFASLQLPFRN